MNKCSCIITLFIFLLVLSTFSKGFIVHYTNSSNPQTPNCPISPIHPQDDALHESREIPSMEWWYFDAVFNQNYGIHIGCKIITIGNWGFVRQLINVYYESEVIKKAYITRPLNQYTISTQYPHIAYQGQDIISFDKKTYEKTGQWIYTIDQQLEDLSVHLTFTGQTKGFKYETSHEGWTVALPQAHVTGRLKIENDTIEVNGTGYHDHNWNFSLSTGIRGTGWYWGKVRSQHYTITWAKIMKTPFADNTLIENLSVINTLHEGYTFIHPDHVTFTAEDLIYTYGRFIPTTFNLNIQQDNIDVNVTFTAISVQRTPPDFLTLHYYRYFMNLNGYIKVGEQTDYLNNKVHIVEFIRFI